MIKYLSVTVILSMFLLLGCVSSNPATWKTLPQMQKGQYDEVWSALVSCITSRNFNLEMSDAGSGYLRTAYGGTGHNTKTRVIARVVSKNPLQISMKAEVLKLNMIGGGWVEVGNNTALENLITEELSARFK